jgi:hypothetical protein
MWAILVAVGAAIVCLNDVFEFVAVRVATDGSNALVLLLLDMQHYGFLIAQIFFGLWLMPLGYLVYRSGMFPRALGIDLNVAGICYPVDMLVLFAVPDFGKQVNAFLVIPPTIPEMWMAPYLLVKGVGACGSRRSTGPDHHNSGRGVASRGSRRLVDPHREARSRLRALLAGDQPSDPGPPFAPRVIFSPLPEARAALARRDVLIVRSDRPGWTISPRWRP